MVDQSLLHFAGNEADWIRRAGVFVAIAGTAAAAPDGTARIFGAVRDALRRAARQLHIALARVLPFLRRSANVHGVTAEGHLRLPKLGLGGGGQVWDPGAPLETQVALLHDQVVQARQDIEQVRQQAREGDAELHGLVEQRVGELRAETQALRGWLDVRERRAAQVDARGVVLIGLSILMTGVPDGLASVLGRAAWVLIVGAPVLAVWVAATVFADLRTSG